jgi:hypothetical protein
LNVWVMPPFPLLFFNWYIISELIYGVQYCNSIYVYNVWRSNQGN